MTVHLAKCSSCKNLVAQDGLEHHIVLLSWISAATAVWVRSMANNATLGLALTTSATMWLRASRREEAAGTIARCNKPLSGRSLREVAMAGLNLMTTDLQPALFSCNRCVGEDGRYKCVAADSIWVGYGSRAAENERLHGLRQRLWDGVKDMEEIYLNGDMEQRIPGNLNISFNFVEGESLIMSLKDIAVSSGSACTSASLEPSYVLRAIGRNDELAHSSIRFTMGRYTTEEEIDFTIVKVREAVEKLRDLSPLWDMHKEGIDLASVQWASH